MPRSLLLLALFFAVAACGPTAATSGSSDGSGPTPITMEPQTEAKGTVPAAMRPLFDAHNRLRAKHCARPLRWSKELAGVAQKWADKLAARGCTFGHSGSRDFGENLAAGTENVLDAAGVAEMWYGEIEKYDFGSGSFSMETGHFTQLVWAGTEHLGCGASTCKGLKIWVCNYDPPGNVEGLYRSNVLPTGCR